MDADKEIDVNGVKRTSEVADRKVWTTMEIRKADFVPIDQNYMYIV